MSKCVLRTKDRAEAFRIGYELRGRLPAHEVQVQCDHAEGDPQAEWDVWLYTDAIIVQVSGGVVQEVIGADHNHHVIVLDWDSDPLEEPVSATVWDS